MARNNNNNIHQRSRRRPYTEKVYRHHNGTRYVSAIMTRGPRPERVGQLAQEAVYSRANNRAAETIGPLPRTSWPLESRIYKPRYRQVRPILKNN